MPRLYVPAPLSVGAEIELPSDAAAHVRALRLRSGDSVTLFNGDGGEHPSELLQVDRRRAWVRIGEHDAVERELPVPVQLLQAIGKGDRMDTAVEKATELGVREIVPILTERTVVRLEDPQRAAKRQRHWTAVAHSACEQCGRNQPPRVHTPTRLDHAWPLAAEFTLRVTLDPTADQRLSQRLKPGTATSLLIGPEGGLTHKELEQAEQHGFVRARSGERILRTETAAVVALTAVGLALGEV